MTITRTRFDNGLTLISEELHAAPVVALQAWVHVGSADETDDIAGIAHVHEHMLFKGTARRGVGEIARTVESSGGEINAWTSFDETVYHLVLAAEQRDVGLDILADALKSSAFDAEELEREVEVVVEEIRRAEDNPARRVAKMLFALAYQRHPYRRPVIGTEEAIRDLTRERILAFFEQYYRPQNTTLVAVGDFDTEDLIASVGRHFGDWQSKGGVPKTQRTAEEPQENMRLCISPEQVKEARIALSWHIPGLHHGAIAAIDTLAVILGHGESSRLYLETRRRRELVNDVYAYAYTPMDPGLLMVGAGLRTERLMPALESVLEQCYRLRNELVPHDELEKAKVIILSEAAYQRETVQGEARKLGFFEVVAGDYAFEEAYYEKLRALTPEDLREAARVYFGPEPTLVLQLPDEDEAPNEAAVRELVGATFSRAGKPKLVGPKKGALDVRRVTLDNGAVVLLKQEDSPVLAIRAVALGGLRWENREIQGLSHLFASVWGQSTEDLGVEALARRVALLGGHISAFAGRNSVGLRGEFIAEKGERGLELFVDALKNRTFVATDLEREREVILERIRNREDNPAMVAFDLFVQTLYPSHPYGMRSIGTEQSVRSFTADDVVRYASRCASPDRMVLSVVGPFDDQHVLDFLAGRLDTPRTEGLGEPPATDGPGRAFRRAARKLDKQQAHIIIGSMGATIDSSERFALEVLSTVLSGQSGRLFLDLRDRQSLAYAVSSTSLDGLDPGYVLVHVGTSPDKVEQALAGVYEHLRRLREEPADEEELERTRRYLIGAHAIDLQRCGARAMIMALGELFGLGYDHHAYYARSIRDVDAAAVQEVAKKYLAPERLVEVVVGPESGEA